MASAVVAVAAAASAVLRPPPPPRDARRGATGASSHERRSRRRFNPPPPQSPPPPPPQRAARHGPTRAGSSRRRRRTARCPADGPCGAGSVPLSMGGPAEAGGHTGARAGPAWARFGCGWVTVVGVGAPGGGGGSVPARGGGHTRGGVAARVGAQVAPTASGRGTERWVASAGERPRGGGGRGGWWPAPGWPLDRRLSSLHRNDEGGAAAVARAHGPLSRLLSSANDPPPACRCWFLFPPSRHLGGARELPRRRQ